MAQLSEKLAELRRRLSDSAHEEQTLIRTLSAALNHVDEELLSEIRHVTAQHEARRAVILNELQHLASRVCALPIASAEPPAPAIEDESERVVPVNGRLGQNGTHATNGTHAPGNWRIAAQNIEDDLDFFDDHPQPIHVPQ
jgi:cell division septum initiation protein DivIVA